MISLKDRVDAMYMESDTHTVFLNRESGKLVTLTEEELHAAEENADLEHFPTWQQGIIGEVRKVIEGDEYLALPDRFDIHEYSIMEQFCQSVPNPAWRRELDNAIRGRGAFRYFKDAIHRLGIADDWYRYRTHAFEEIAVRWLESNEVAYRRDTDSE